MSSNILLSTFTKMILKLWTGSVLDMVFDLIFNISLVYLEVRPCRGLLKKSMSIIPVGQSIHAQNVPAIHFIY